MKTEEEVNRSIRPFLERVVQILEYFDSIELTFEEWNWIKQSVENKFDTSLREEAKKLVFKSDEKILSLGGRYTKQDREEFLKEQKEKNKQ